MMGTRQRRSWGDIEIADVRHRATPGGARASAALDGAELFFESRGIALVAPPELFASAVLPVAVQRGVRLVMDAPVDRAWRRNMAAVLRVWARWWGTEPDLARVLVAPRSPRRLDPRVRSRRVGLCFSLGLDSFHTLLRSGERIDDLVLAHGFDIPLDDEERFRDAESSLNAVAAATGKRAVTVRTNLRRHPSMRPMAWPRTHGGALAALGHACGSALGELLISATKPRVADGPWGSHWDTDPGFSSTRVRIRHVGEDRRRNEKIRALAAEPLVHRHLRVCWENRAPTGNCGECEKCVRTMLLLAASAGPAALASFPDGPGLHERIDAVPRIHPDSAPVYETLLADGLDGRTAEAVRRLLQRSTVAAPAW